MTTGWKLLIVLLLVAGAYFGGDWRGHATGVAEVMQKWDAEKLERSQAALQADQEARRMEQRRQALVTEAANAAKKREQDLRRDADRARSEQLGLHDDLAASTGQLSGASCEAVRQRAAALTDVFDQCTGSYQGLAEKADGHASDALMFDQAWPVDDPSTTETKGASHGTKHP